MRNKDFEADLEAIITGNYIPKRYRGIINRYRDILDIDDRPALKYAISEGHKKTTILGKAKAIASTNHELQLPIELTIVPLGVVNQNKQGINISEKDNLLLSARHMPIRANFYDGELHGHTGADEVGVITDVRYDADTDTIMAAGIIWTENNPDLAQYLLDNETVGSSFEMYYSQATLRGDIEWLYGCVFAAQSLVAHPAYGHRTNARIAAEMNRPYRPR